MSMKGIESMAAHSVIIPSALFAPRTETILVSPEFAAQSLAGRCTNRHISQSIVDTYAADMTRGMWKLTHQGIAFNDKGELVDGQHRLSAIVKTGIPCLMMVTWGLTLDVTAPIDEGKRRNVRDAYALRGEDVSPTSVAVVKAFIKSTKGWAGQANRSSRSEVMQMMDEIKVQLGLTVNAMGLKRKRMQSPAAIGAVILRVIICIPNRVDETLEFVDILMGDIRDKYSAHEQSVFRLREMLGNGGSRYSSQEYVYRKVESAIQAFLEHRPLAKVYEASEELFPVAYDLHR